MLALLPLFASAWIGALTLVLIGIVVLDKGSRAGGSWMMTALAGCSFGLAAGFRFEAAIFVISATPFLFGNGRQSKIVFSAGLGAGLLPTVASLLIAGPLTVWEIVSPRLGADASLPEVTKATWLFGAISLAGGLSFVVRAWRLRWTPWAVACALTSLLAFPQMVQRFDIYHVAYVGAFTAAGLAALPGPTRWTSLDIQRVLRRSVLTVPLALAVTVFLLSLPFSAVRYEHGDRWLYLAPEDAESFALLTEELDRLKVPDGVALFVGAQDMSHPLAIPMWHYHLLPEYPTRARFLELFPNMTELADSGLDHDILNAELLLLFDLSHQEGKYTPNIPPGSQQANMVVERAFCHRSTVGEIAIHLPVGACSAFR